ncbi:MAG TPA: metallophosphoesterase [Bacteroidales bacterium]|jgi:predicted MPP superfamily phosphohydrolase|nr:metallophosphoesterase [Bacteroidales bacterium]
MVRKSVFFSLILVFTLRAFASEDSVLRIVQISDVQLGFTMARSGEKNGKIDSLLHDVDEKYFRRAVQLINNLSPATDVILNTGDLVNDPDNPEQWKTYSDVAAGFKAPLYEVMGNHDGWSSHGIRAFKDRFVRNDYYSFKIKNCLFVVLNSWYLKHPEQNPSESKLQKEFAEKILDTDSSSFRILVMHFPVYIEKPDEEDAYFNLPLQERMWLLDLASANGVKLILSGHSHRNIIQEYNDSLTLITTGPVSEPLGLNSDKTPSVRGFRIIDINLNNSTYTHKFINLPEYAIEIPEKRSYPGGKDFPDGFSFAFLGDTHFDEPEHHDMKWVLREHPRDTSQITKYCRNTKNVLPELFGDLRSLIVNNNVGMVLHTGDFTEGLCGSYSLAHKQLSDFISFSGNYINVPFLLTRGNHDITGPGADSAYKKVVFPFLSIQTGKNVTDSKYSYIKGNSAFFFYDSYDPSSLAWLEEQMKKYHKVKFKFVIMHEPVVPINARSKWTEFSGPEETLQREKLLNILGDNNAIVMAGHLHCYGLVLRKTRKGAFVQLSGSSVPDRLNEPAGKYLEGKKAYGIQLIQLEPAFSPNDKRERINTLKNEKRWIKHFEYAEIQGYIVLTVKGSQVFADVYSGTGFNKWKTVNLTSLFE